MSDHLSRLRRADEKAHRERKKREAQRVAREAERRQFNGAWTAVYDACQAGDQNTGSVPNLSPFLVLAKALKRRGWDVWLPEMADGLSEELDHQFIYRPGQVFIVELLKIAVKPRATVKQLAIAYQSFVPSNAPRTWRNEAARDICEYIATRAVVAEQAREYQQRELAEKAAEARLAALREAAAKRPALGKQLFAVHWYGQGIRPAAIRDKWNQIHPRDVIDSGTAGREDIKSSMRRGRDFLRDHGASITEASELLGMSFDK
jgi:hypothetical protein